MSELSTLEKRKQFVQHRFAEPQIFGRANIEHWIKVQREREAPEGTTCMGRDALSGAVGDWLAILRNHASRYGFVDRKISPVRLLKKIGLRLSDCDDSICNYVDRIGAFHWLLGSIGLQKEDVFLTTNSMLVVPKCGDNGILVLTPGADHHVGGFREGTLSNDVIYSALHCWFFFKCKNENSIRARQYLCDWLEKVIYEEQRRAEEHFNSAVAVSMDDSKIVHAEWVVLYDLKNHKFQLYEGEEFVNRKIIREQDMVRQDHHPIFMGNNCRNIPKRIAEVATLLWGKGKPNQHLFPVDTQHHAHRCLFMKWERELPLGGITVEVNEYQKSIEFALTDDPSEFE